VPSEKGNVSASSLDVSRWSAEELLLRAAWFYYKDELTQDEIAKRLSVSRASVGRILERARRVGLVSINLNAEYLNAFELSADLRRVFGLSEALVVPDHDKEPVDRRALNARVGLGGAQFLSTHLRPGGSLGVGWGDTVSRVIAATNFGAVGPVHMITLTGGVDGYLQTILSVKGDTPENGELLTTAAVIPAPNYASSAALAAALRQEPTIQQVIKHACEAEQAVVGVGTPTRDATIVQLGYLTPDDLKLLEEYNVVGDILGQFFDANGAVVDISLHDRRIGIELSDLKLIPKVIGIAGGTHKIHAMLGALRGGFLDVLVTNEIAAIALLELERRGKTRA
jgi:lsr operon transcriptional repressor